MKKRGRKPGGKNSVYKPKILKVAPLNTRIPLYLVNRIKKEKNQALLITTLLCQYYDYPMPIEFKQMDRDYLIALLNDILGLSDNYENDENVSHETIERN